jgi:hypothetical protein
MGGDPFSLQDLGDRSRIRTPDLIAWGVLCNRAPPVWRSLSRSLVFLQIVYFLSVLKG